MADDNDEESDVLLTVSKSKLLKHDRKHHNCDNWRKCFLYKNHRKIDMSGKLVDNYKITAIKDFRDNILYKCPKLSEKDENWDYYKIIKPHIKGDIAIKKNNVYKHQKFKNKSIVITSKSELGDNPIIVDFS